MQDLSSKQRDALLNSNARINIFEGPVRAGKSFVSLVRWLDFCINGPPGDLIIVGRTDKTIKRNIINPFQKLIGTAVDYKAGKGEVNLYNRRMFVVGANDDRAEAKIRGSEFAGALIDEATLIPETFFKMLLSRLSIPNSSLFCSTNPDSPYHWLKTDFIDRKDELDLKVFSFDIRDNPSLTEEYIKQLSKEYQGLWYKRYIEGEWVLADGAIYDFFNVETHTILYPQNHANEYIVGVDYGTANPCVMLLIGINEENYPHVWVEKEYYFDSRAEMRQKSDYEYGQDLLKFIDNIPVSTIYVDPSALSFINEIRKICATPVREANNDVLDGIRFVSTMLTTGKMKICRACTNLLKEMNTYSWDESARIRGEDKPKKRNDHACVTGDTLITLWDGKQIFQTSIKVLAEQYAYNPERFSSTQLLNFKEGKIEIDGFVNPSITRQDSEIYELELEDGSILKATPDHAVFTQRGYVELQHLMLSDMVITCNTNITTERNSI